MKGYVDARRLVTALVTSTDMSSFHTKYKNM